MKSEYYLGIDFGTSNCSVAVLPKGESKIFPANEPTVLPLEKNGSTTMPSILFFPYNENEYYVGNEAIERYLSTNLKGRLIQSVKTLLPDASFTGTNIYGWGHFTAEDMVFHILLAIKHRLELFINQDIAEVVIGRPAIFSEDTEEEKTAECRLLRAAKRAGFENVCFQREPIAAALTYEHSLHKPELAFIGDFGGGTSDFTLMHLSPHRIGDTNRDDDIIAVNGISIAGNAFNGAIMRHQLLKYFGYGAQFEVDRGRWIDAPIGIQHNLCEPHKISFLKNFRDRALIRELIHSSNDKQGFIRLQSLIEENLGYMLFQNIQEAKCLLSSNQTSRITFNRSTINIDEEITQQNFEKMIEDYIEKLELCIDRTLEIAKTSTKDVDAVFLTGGTSQTPRIRQLMAKKFGEAKLRPGDAFTSVAEGLALSAPYLFKQ